MRELGRHAFVDGWDVDPGLLNDRQRLEKILKDACTAAGATLMRTASQRFIPQGVTVVIILAESHASIHTDPENGRYMADVFTCGDVKPNKAIELLVDAMGGESRVSMMSRG
jgi:S-adenosylmethionine decarboxylase proenzyme